MQSTPDEIQARLDALSQEEHVARLEAARDRIQSRIQARRERARRAAARLRGGE